MRRRSTDRGSMKASVMLQSAHFTQRSMKPEKQTNKKNTPGLILQRTAVTLTVQTEQVKIQLGNEV